MAKTIEVIVDGFAPMQYSAATASAAFMEAFRAYCSAYPKCTFKRFLQISSRKTIRNPPGVGDPIRVNGRNAIALEPRQHLTRFYYLGEKTSRVAHHSDIEEVDKMVRSG